MFRFFSKNTIERAEKKAERYLDDDVLSVAIGNKITTGATTNDRSVTFFVKKKLPKAVLSKKELLPEVIDGFKTDVIDLGGEIEPLHRKQHRPVVGGISGMTEGLTACTLGAIVFKNNEPHILTNAHCVFGRDINDWAIGKKWLQPSPNDKGKDAIGTVKYPNPLKENEINKIDSSIVPLDVDYKLEMLNHGDYTKEWVEPTIGKNFYKIGRTTGKTEGVITHTMATALVRYGDKVLKFFPCFFALQDNYSLVAPGDSGSVAFCDKGVLGQVFAASPNLAIFIYGSSIQYELGITLDKAEPAYIALGSWMQFNRLDITLTSPTNLRKEPKIGNNVIRVLPKGTKLQVIGGGGVADNYFWVKVKASH